LCSFSLLTVIWLCNFWQNNIVEKAVCKMQVKLNTGVNFIEIFRPAFLPVDLSVAWGRA